MSNQKSDITDDELLHHYYQDYDNKWLGILLPRYALLLFGVCMKYLKNEDDSKDCVQHIYLKVINELYKFRVKNFKSWLYMVAKNECLMRLRSAKNGTVELNETFLPETEDAGRKEVLMEREKKIGNLYKSLEKLKPDQQQCIRYFYMEKKSYAEIGELTGFTISQVKSYLQNGKRNLEILMASGETKNM